MGLVTVMSCDIYSPVVEGEKGDERTPMSSTFAGSGAEPNRLCARQKRKKRPSNAF